METPKIRPQEPYTLGALLAMLEKPKTGRIPHEGSERGKRIEVQLPQAPRD